MAATIICNLIHSAPSLWFDFFVIFMFITYYSPLILWSITTSTVLITPPLFFSFILGWIFYIKSDRTASSVLTAVGRERTYNTGMPYCFLFKPFPSFLLILVIIRTLYWQFFKPPKCYISLPQPLQWLYLPNIMLFPLLSWYDKSSTPSNFVNYSFNSYLRHSCDFILPPTLFLPPHSTWMTAREDYLTSWHLQPQCVIIKWYKLTRTQTVPYRRM